MKNTKINLNENLRKILKAMPSVDSYSSRREWEDVCFKRLLKLKDALTFFLTFDEKRNLAMRAAVLKEVLTGKGPRQISRELFVSLQTINAVKKAAAGNNYQSYFERSKEERKKRQYSPWPVSGKKPRREGIPHRTKYGTIYLPY